LHPAYIIRHDEIIAVNDTLRDLGIYARINKINPEDNSVEFGIRQRSQQDDYIVMKAMIFPYIGVLWSGIIVMIVGFGISWAGRRQRRLEKA
jgi:cytochrome c-type biogenesis protein CcmF